MLFNAALILSFTLLAVASPASPQEKRATAKVITKCTVPNTVALTFDDGPYIYMRDIIDTLDDAGAKGTFFYNGDNYDCIYSSDEASRIKYAYDQGHQIGSHTWRHADLNTLSSDEVDSEMSRVEDALEKITGARVAFTRPPYGNYNDNVREVADSRGQSLVIWDFDSGDSVGASVEESNSRYDDVVKKHPSTLLALNHEVYETTAHQVLPHAIQALQGAGYKLVTVAECIGQSPYKSVGSPSPRDSSWKC